MSKSRQGVNSPAIKKAKRPNAKFMGAPSKYKPEYCEKLVSHMASGMSFASFAGIIKVTIVTVYEWCKVHGDFSKAKAEGTAANLAFWEQQGIDGLWIEKDGKKLNTSAYVFNLANRFPDEWGNNRKDEKLTPSLHTVRIELPGQGAEQVISVDPKGIEE